MNPATRVEIPLPTKPVARWSAAACTVGTHLVCIALLAIVVRRLNDSPTKEETRSIPIVSLADATPRRNLFAQKVASPATKVDSNPSPSQIADGLPSSNPAWDSNFDSRNLPTLPGPLEKAEQFTTGVGKLLGVKSGRNLPHDVDEEKILEGDRALLKSREPVGPVGELSLFGAPSVQGRKFIFVIDRSKSMGREGLDVLKSAEKEIVKALAPLQPTHKFQIIAYHDRCTYLNRNGLASGDEAGKRSVHGFLTELAAFGGTNHLQALLAAIVYQPDVVFFLTDGTDPILTDVDIQNLLSLTKGRTQFHCFRFGNDSATDDDFMKKLAAATGGAFHFVHSAKLGPEK